MNRLEQSGKKILMIISSLQGGGAERVFVRLASYLSSGNDVILLPVFRCTTDYHIPEKVRIFVWNPSEAGFVARWFNWRTIVCLFDRFVLRKDPYNLTYSLFLSRTSALVSRLRRKEKPDVVLSFLEVPNQLNSESSGPGKTVMSERNNPLRKDGDYFDRMCEAYSRADKVIFQSKTVMDMFPESIRRKGVVLPNPIEVSCGAVCGSKRIVSIGRLHPQKNQTLLIRAFARFSKDHPEHTLHIYGEGDLRASLNSLIRDLALEGKVFLEGYLPDVHKSVSDAQMFVLSSDYEGMPNCLLEAMMMGLPCVTTSFEGAGEFFGDTGSCLMVPLRDEEALAGAMSRLADDEQLRKELSSCGVELADRYSVEKVIPLWEKELFCEL